MMNYDNIITMISSVGFPIVACGALAWFVNTTLKRLTDSVDSLVKLVEKVVDNPRSCTSANNKCEIPHSACAAIPKML